jgi:uncharacterized membrane protein YgcG
MKKRCPVCLDYLPRCYCARKKEENEARKESQMPYPSGLVDPTPFISFDGGTSGSVDSGSSSSSDSFSGGGGSFDGGGSSGDF